MIKFLKKKIIMIFFLIFFLYTYQNFFDILMLFHFDMNKVLIVEIVCLFFMYIFIFFTFFFTFFFKIFSGFFLSLSVFLLGSGIFFFSLTLNINQFC